jgi:hypothetical protein
MGSRMQSIGDFVYPLVFAVIIGLVIAVLFALYTLGNLPGRIARERGHPRCAAISICGWLGLLLFFPWPVALVWAYMTPKDHPRGPNAEELDPSVLSEAEVAALAEDLREAAMQIAAIKDRLAALSPLNEMA